MGITVVGDIEANGLYDDVTQIWCAVFKNVSSHALTVFTPHTINKLPDFLDGIDVLIMHNGAQYDLPVIKKVLGYNFKGLLVDSLAVSRIERPTRLHHSLDSWGITLRFPKTEFDEWHRYSEQMLEYCKNDVELTHRVAQELGCDQPNFPVRFRVVSTLFKNLFEQEQNGWRVDIEHLNHCIHTLDRWMDRIRRVTLPHLPMVVEPGTPVSRPFKRDGNLSVITKRYCEQSGLDFLHVAGPFSRVDFRPISLDKPGELKDLLLNLGWIPEQWNVSKQTGKKTSPKLSVDDRFEGIDGNLGGLLVKYTQCKQRRAVLDGWSQSLRGDGRLPSRVSGLAVTSRARHSIIANVPRNTSFFGQWLRKCFIAREGWSLVGADAETCQLRMLAARMGDPDYIYSVCNEDVHVVNMEAAEIDDRTDAKTLIYALIFGASNAKLTRMLKKDAAPIRRRLLTNLPALARLMREEEAKWKATAKTRLNRWGKVEYYDGHVIGLDGRCIPVNSPHKILMGLLQSDEAILMQYAYNLFRNKCHRIGFKHGIDFGVCCWYHDELQSESRPELAHILGQLKCDSIVEAGEYLNIACPMSGSYTVGNNWSETH